MKKLILALSLSFMFMFPVIGSNPPAAEDAFCVQPKGQLLGRINQMEAQGWTLTSIDCQPVYYLVQPEPPYVSNIVTVTMRKIQCPPAGQLGPCILLGTARFTADEVVVNNNGNTVFQNITDVFVAL